MCFYNCFTLRCASHIEHLDGISFFIRCSLVNLVCPIRRCVRATSSWWLVRQELFHDFTFSSSLIYSVESLPILLAILVLSFLSEGVPNLRMIPRPDELLAWFDTSFPMVPICPGTHRKFCLFPWVSKCFLEFLYWCGFRNTIGWYQTTHTMNWYK